MINDLLGFGLMKLKVVRIILSEGVAGQDRAVICASETGK